MSPTTFPPAPDRARRARLRERLVCWYVENARDLPWRRTRDPYRIWVSEAMLQQTRVETVREYYERFLERFPTVVELAAAPVDDVLALWSGLGYYRRARALHDAARVIVAEHGGRFPAERAAALGLPGVGPYTAGAVLSIAYDLPEPLVDGNVERVFSRVFLLDDHAGAPALTRECWSLAGAFASDAGPPGEWNQALMELGATVCTPRTPRCLLCPLSSLCRGRRAGRAEELPGKKPKRAVIEVELELLVEEPGRAGEVLLERRPGRGRMAGMWQFPTIELANSAGSRSGLFPPSWPRGVRLAREPLFELRHGITCHRIRGVARGPRALPAAGRWPESWNRFPLPEARTLALTGMAKKVVTALQRRPIAAEGG